MDTTIDAATIDKPTPHPAKFTPAIWDVICELLVTHALEGGTVLDPFAGVGTIHDLRPDYETFGVEIEPEWAVQAAERGPTICADFLTFPADGRRVTQYGEPLIVGQDAAGDPICVDGPGVSFPADFDIILTSPAYGNRMADNHTPSPEDTSTRITYRHKLGRPLTDGNAGGMQWGPQYRSFHRRAWLKVSRLLRDDGRGLFILNVKDHVRRGEIQPVTAWHEDLLYGMGFEHVETRQVPVKGMGFGANQNGEGKAKVDHESVIVFRWPGA